jgi:type I restriction enzyme S subunit
MLKHNNGGEGMQQEIRERIDMIRRGDIPLGYKKTSVGVIPDNWNVKKIGDISKINLLSLSSDTANDYEFYYYDLSSIDEGKINHPNIKTKYSESPSRARRIFRRNDILMSTVRPNLKGFAKIDFDAEDCVSSTGFAVITVNDEDDFDFLYHNLFSYNIEQQINSLLVGSNYPAINNEDVENLCIPYISIKSEQQKIAAILSTWDKAIELKEKLIAQKQVQKKGLAQNLLTGKIRVNEIGSINHEQLKQRLFLIHNGEVPEGYQKTK